MSSSPSLSNRSTPSALGNPPSSSFQLAPAWLKSPSGAPPPPTSAPKSSSSTGTSNGPRSGTSSSMIQLGGQSGGRSRNGPYMPGTTHHSDHNGHSSYQRPPSAGDFPSLDHSTSKPRTAGQPASKKNWKEAALAVDLSAASKDPVPAQEREREREKEREKEKLVNLVPKAPTPKKGGAHGKGAPPGKNPRDRDTRGKAVHEPPPPPKPLARSESPVAGGGMVVLSLPKATKVRAVRQVSFVSHRPGRPTLPPHPFAGPSLRRPQRRFCPPCPPPARRRQYRTWRQRPHRRSRRTL